MPPHIYNTDDEDFAKPFQYLHPGIKKTTFAERISQHHVFQQSVTLTASMWNENEPKGKTDWNLENWRVLGKYSPLLIGLVCGFVIVLLIMSTVMLWRYCIISASKKVCCKATYSELSHNKSLPSRKDAFSCKNENCQNKFSSVGRFQLHSTLHRSATVGSMPWRHEVENKALNPVNYTNDISSRLQHQSTPMQPLMSEDLHPSHLHLQKIDSMSLDAQKSLSKSTPALEDLYMKVNFSKKCKNRMRKNEAAIIAMSKSHNGQNNNSLELFGSAIVVYNERTAL